MDWSDCPHVEREQGKVSGAWVVKGSRVPADAIIDNARDGFTAEAIAEMFEGLSVQRVRAVLRFAELHAPAP
jgi:uncharacterized protein (DUF433 family)